MLGAGRDAHSHSLPKPNPSRSAPILGTTKGPQREGEQPARRVKSLATRPTPGGYKALP